MNDGTSRRLVWLSLLLGVLAAASLSIDLPVARHWRRFPLLNDPFRAIHFAELFGHAIGVAWILVMVAVLDPHRHKRIVLLTVMAFGAGVWANLLKLLVARWRPDSSHRIKTVWETFIGWRPTAEMPVGLPKWTSAVQSFPSAHAATAAGLAVGLSLLYPRGRWLFLVCAALSCLQRLVDSRHFTSDVLAGAALGCLWSAVTLRSPLANRGQPL